MRSGGRFPNRTGYRVAVTAMRDRHGDPDADEFSAPWDERPIAGIRRGLPWWAAVLLGFGSAILGAFVDLKLQGHLTLLFKACYCAGAVAAVCWVQRRGLFGPMVQPPLILAVTVPGVVLFASGLPANSDMLSTLLVVGRPLIDGFPTMAITTGTTVIIGFVRMYRERDPDALRKTKATKPRPSPQRPASERPSAGDTAARATAGGGRTRPAPGQATQRRGSTEANRRAGPASEPGMRRASGELEPGPRSARQPREPGARRPAQPRDPRGEDGAPRRRERRADGARVRRADDPRGTDVPRPAPRRRGDTPPPRSRPWDNEN